MAALGKLRAASVADALGDRSVQVASAVVPDAAGPTDAGDVLADVSLPNRVQSIVCPPLEALGFTLREGERRDEFGVTSKQILLASSDEVDLVLLHVPRGVLSSPSPPNVQAVQFLEHVLDAGDCAMIFSEKLRGLPEPPYRLMWKFWAGAGKVSVGYVAWSDLESLARRPDDERPDALKQILELALLQGAPDALIFSTSPSRNAALPPEQRPHADVNLSIEEIDLLVKVISEVAQGAMVEPAVFFNNLVSGTGVPDDEASKIKGSWSGDLEIDSRRLVGWARPRKFRPGDPQYENAVIGVLVERITKELFTDDVQQLGRMVRHRCLLVPDRMAKLATALGIDDEGANGAGP